MMNVLENSRGHSLALRASCRKSQLLALRAGSARGAVLLEVIISMGLLIFGMAVVGLQVNAGLDAARSADIGTRAVMLADSKLAEFKAGILQAEKNDDEMKGDFGAIYPGYTWRVTIQPTDLEVFNMMTLEIGFNRRDMETKINNPDQELDFEDEGTRIIQTAHRLIPIPADVNLERDFGLSQDELARLQDPGGGSGEPGGNGGEAGGLNSLNDLLANLGSLSDLQNFDPRMLSSLPDEEFAKIARLLEAFLGRGSGTNSSPEDMLNDLLKDSRSKSGNGNQNSGANDGTTGGGNQAGGGQQGGGNTGNSGGNTGNNRPGGNRQGEGSRSGSNADNGDDSDSNSDGQSGNGEGRRGGRRGRNRDRDGNDSSNSSDSGNDSGGTGRNRNRDGNNNNSNNDNDNDGNIDNNGRRGGNGARGNQPRNRRQRENDNQDSGDSGNNRGNSQQNNNNEDENEQPRRRTRQRS